MDPTLPVAEDWPHRCVGITHLEHQLRCVTQQRDYALTELARLRLAGPVLGGGAVLAVWVYALVGHVREVRTTVTRAEDYAAARRKERAP